MHCFKVFLDKFLVSQLKTLNTINIYIYIYILIIPITFMYKIVYPCVKLVYDSK